MQLWRDMRADLARGCARASQHSERNEPVPLKRGAAYRTGRGLLPARCCFGLVMLDLCRSRARTPFIPARLFLHSARRVASR